jgi:plastocyanin
MRRLMVVAVLTTLASALLLASPSTAGAGGFCSDGSFTDERGDTVALSMNCMTPTILRVEQGAAVRFVNEDNTLHMLGGVTNIFGNMHTELPSGESLTYTFKDEGVFPYVCVLHPGMAGAIVVGDGEGKVTTSSVTGGSITPPSDDTAVADETEATVDSSPARPARAGTSSDLIQVVLVLAAVTAGLWWTKRRLQPEV